MLVGPGATDFASEVGIPIVLPDFLVSAAAGERYARWKADLNRAGKYEESDSDRESDAPTSMSGEPQNRDLAGCWNESQPYSPRVTASEPTLQGAGYDAAGEIRRKRSFWSSNEPGNDGQYSLKVREEGEETSTDDSPYSFKSKASRRTIRNATSSGDGTSEDLSDGGVLLPAPLIPPPPTRAASPTRKGDPRLSGRVVGIEAYASKGPRQDDITDTVGAIAVDCFGNLAAGSSSGGIGMKHKGRVGPAALVGIGTAVIPFEPDDKDKTCVATVTSGTGEHMATTTAAGTCAGRLYSSTRRTRRGESESTDDDSAIKGFVERDFMGK